MSSPSLSQKVVNPILPNRIKSNLSNEPLVQESGLFDAQTHQSISPEGQQLENITDTALDKPTPRERAEKTLEKLGINPKEFGKDFKLLKKLFIQLYKSPDHQEVHFGSQMALMKAIQGLLGLDEVLLKETITPNGVKLTWVVEKNLEASNSDFTDSKEDIELFRYYVTPMELRLLTNIDALKRRKD